MDPRFAQQGRHPPNYSFGTGVPNANDQGPPGGGYPGAPYGNYPVGMQPQYYPPQGNYPPGAGYPPMGMPPGGFPPNGVPAGMDPRAAAMMHHQQQMHMMYGPGAGGMGFPPPGAGRGQPGMHNGGMPGAHDVYGQVAMDPMYVVAYYQRLAEQGDPAAAAMLAAMSGYNGAGGSPPGGGRSQMQMAMQILLCYC